MPSVEEMLQDSMKQMITDNNEFYAKQKQYFEENQARIKQAQNQFLQNKQELVAENQEIAYIFTKLQANRQLIAEVKKFIDDKLANVNSNTNNTT